MKLILKIYSLISLLGVESRTEKSIISQNKIIINRSIFWISIITIIYCIFYFLFNLYALLFAGLIYYSLWNTLYFLTFRGKFTLAKFLILLIGNFQLITLNYFAGGDSGIYIFFIPASIAPFLFYEKDDKKYIIFFTLLSAFLSLVCIYLKEKDISYYSKFDINFHLILYTLSLQSSIALSIFFIGFLFYIKNIHANLQEKESENSENLLAALSESLTKTSKILDTTGEGYWFLQNTVITEINTSLAILLGRTKDEILGRDISDFLDVDGLQIFKTDTEVITKEKKITHELSLTKKNGTSIPCLLHSTFFEKDLEGNVGIFSFITDISEMKYFQKELIKSVKQADDATRAKSLFLANVSHEIRTPMNSIIGLSELAIQNRKPEKIFEYLEKINSSANSLLKIINDILDFSKIESGKAELEVLPFNIISIIENIRTMLDFKLKEKSLNWKFNYDPNLPELLIGDSLKVQQVLINLLHNSIKFTDKGDIGINIQKYTEDENSIKLKIFVSDTGIGITEEQIHKLFKPFSQAENSTQRKFGGTGLGLSIIKKILEMMQGSITVQSEVGKGTEFSIIIPFKKYTESTSNSILTPGILKVNRINLDFSNLNILIVDDNEINREIIKEQLSREQIHTLEATNGQECLDILSTNKNIDLVLMDIQMPVLDGIETSKKIKNDPVLSSIPIIILSAHGFEEEKERCRKIGISEFLVKPVDYEELLQKISSVIFNDVRTPEAKIISENGFNLMPSIEGLDIKSGLRRVMGNQEAYRELLKKFITNQKDFVTRLQFHFDKGDNQALQRECHSLAGISANLGFTEIFQLSKSIENKIRNLEIQFISSDLSILTIKLNKLLKELGFALEQEK